jgi:hypothetical protein
MADSIVGGLFGMTPESYQDTRQQLEQRQAFQQAQLDPYEAVNYMAARAGQQLGRGIGGALGAEDPQLKLISARNAVIQGIDLNNPEALQAASARLAQIGDMQGAYGLAEVAQKRAESQATIGLREAQAKKANEYQMATTSSERNRKLISEADVALKEGRPLTAPQESALRYQVAQELKPKVFRDANTGELTTIDPLNIGLAAPNVAKYLKLGETTGTAGGVTTIQTPQSQEAQVSQAEALNELTSRTKDIRDVIGDTKKLISGYTTGYGSFLSVLPLTDAKTLQNNLESIKANLSLSQLTALKEASKTGASGLGQVTRNEFEALQSTIAKLDPQSKSFADDLDKVDKTYSRLLKQLESKTVRAEERVKATQPKKPEVPGLAPSDVAPQKSRFSGLNPELKAEESLINGQTKKGTKYQIMQ